MGHEAWLPAALPTALPYGVSVHQGPLLPFSYSPPIAPPPFSVHTTCSLWKLLPRPYCGLLKLLPRLDCGLLHCAA